MLGETAASCGQRVPEAVGQEPQKQKESTNLVHWQLDMELRLFRNTYQPRAWRKNLSAYFRDTWHPEQQFSLSLFPNNSMGWIISTSVSFLLWVPFLSYLNVKVGVYKNCYLNQMDEFTLTLPSVGQVSRNETFLWVSGSQPGCTLVPPVEHRRHTSTGGPSL